jgi:LAO/AO transport system kinase
MLDLGPPRDWVPPVVRAVATTGDGVDEVWNGVLRHRRYLASAGELERRRAARAVAELESALRRRLREQIADGEISRRVLGRVLAREVDPWSAADAVVAGDSRPELPG